MIKCSNCGTDGEEGQLVCEKCGALFYNASVSTVLMRVDPTLMRLRRQRQQAVDMDLPERTIVLHIRGMAERLSFEDGTEVILGRSDVSAANTDRLDLSRYGAHERGVSREHALLRYKDNELSVTDLKSVNRTFVNLIELKPNQPHRLQNGDELMLGTLNFDSSGTLVKPTSNRAEKTVPINRKELMAAMHASQQAPQNSEQAQESVDSDQSSEINQDAKDETV
jgi:hypothetical protein